MFVNQNTRKNRNKQRANKAFGNVAKSKNLRVTVMDENYIYNGTENIKLMENC
jgi:hypothetical protein